MKRIMKFAISIAGLLVVSALGLQTRVGAKVTAQEEDYTPLLKVLSNSKHTLADGVRHATKSTEVPISAKFDLDSSTLLKRTEYGC